MSEFKAVATDDFRRKWDKAEWEEKARKEREEGGTKKVGDKSRGRKRKHGHHGAERADVCSDYESDEDANDPEAPRDPLRPREYKVDLESRVGKSFVVTKAAPLAQQTGAGYYCDVCDCVVKDSTNFLDHINGRKHQRNLGMSMKVSKSTVDDVRRKLTTLKQVRESEKREYNLEERLKEIREEEQRIKMAKKEKQKDKKSEASTSNADDDKDDLAAVMGFSGFGAAKKK